MKELINMWKNTRMIVLTAVCAAVYAAVLIPFKVAIPIIPGFTEVRPAGVIPIICSLMFGPAAAWGSAIGNTIADAFGTFGIGTLFGFVGNFLYGYIPYRMWKAFGEGDPIGERRRSVWTAAIVAVIFLILSIVVPPAIEILRSPSLSGKGLPDGFSVFFSLYELDFSSRAVLIGIFLVTPVVFIAMMYMSARYLISIFSASAACGVFIGWGVHIVGLVPFPALGNIIVLNNLLVSAVLGPILLPTLYPVVKRMGLLYTDVMDKEDISKPRVWGSALMIASLVLALVLGNWIAIGGYKMGVLANGFGPVLGQTGLGLALLPFIILILLAAVVM